MAFCSKCGNQLSEGAKYCPKCGGMAEDKYKQCPKCGFERQGTEKFCPKCGTTFEATGIIEENKKNNSFIKNSVIFALFVLMFFLAVYAFYNLRKSGSSVSGIRLSETAVDSSEYDYASDSYDTSNYYNSYKEPEANNEYENDEKRRAYFTESSIILFECVEKTNSIKNEIESLCNKYAALSSDDGRMRNEITSGYDELVRTANVFFNNSIEELKRTNDPGVSRSSERLFREKKEFEEFVKEHFIMMYLANQTFCSDDGLCLRFDGRGRMYLNDDYVGGFWNIQRYDSKNALLEYGEGKLSFRIEGNKIQLSDPKLGIVFYQK